MRRAMVFAVIGAVIWALCSSFESVAGEEKVEKALEAANKWTALIDERKYGESWETAAVYFKNAIGKEVWEQKLAAVRKPLGKLVSRRLKSKTYTTSLPGAPDGEYVVLQFITSFENKDSGIETVTPMLDSDGIWRVSGYYIK
jgi:hypothetical protein